MALIPIFNLEFREHPDHFAIYHIDFQGRYASNTVQSKAVASTGVRATRRGQLVKHPRHDVMENTLLESLLKTSILWHAICSLNMTINPEEWISTSRTSGLYLPPPHQVFWRDSRASVHDFVIILQPSTFRYSPVAGILWLDMTKQRHCRVTSSTHSVFRAIMIR